MKTFDTPEPISADIDLAVGVVHLTAHETTSTSVEVLPSDGSNDEDVRAAEQTRVDLTGDRLEIRGPKLRSWLSRGGGGSVDLVLTLPTGSHLDYTVGMGDVHADGLLGDCRVRTGLGQIGLDQVGALTVKSGAGKVQVERVSGAVEITDGSGSVRIGAIGGAAMIKNSNGETWIGEAHREVRVKAANGSIVIDRSHADVSATSANGDVRLGAVERGVVDIKTAMGDLEVGIREGVAAWLDVNATAGTVRNTLESSGAPTDQTAEIVEVRARTTIGEILIGRANQSQTGANS
jgi:hypothetical protein